MLGKQFSRALAVATAGTLILASAASADVAVAEGDNATPVDPHALAMGDVCRNATSSDDALLAISRNGNYGSTNVFKKGSSITWSVVSATVGLSAMFPDGATGSIPADWDNVDNNTMSPAITTSVSYVAPDSTGSFTGTITFRATGIRADDTALTRDTEMSVTASRTTCVIPDTAAPTNALIVINNGASWTNSLSAQVDISATDNVGVTGYALAPTQELLPATPTVSVASDADFSASDPFTLEGPDGSNSAWVRFFDAQGNYADASDTIVLDRTKPVISASTGTYVPGTWTNQSVSVTFTCADAGTVQSDIATDSVAGGNTTLSGGGENQSVPSSGVCTDNAGNFADAITVSNIDIDKTKPTSVVQGFANGAVYELGDTLPTVSCVDSDDLSGIATGGTLTSPASLTGVGTFAFSCNGAVDNAGNVQTLADSKSYSVIFDWNGFFAPVENLSAWNSAKAGQSIPVKFSLGGDQGLNIFATDAPYNGAPRIVQIACPSSGTPDPIEEYATTTANSKLIYDSLADQYNYVWKTDKAWAGKCFRLDVNLIDGTTHNANFKFTK